MVSTPATVRTPGRSTARTDLLSAGSPASASPALDRLTGDAQTFREKVWASGALHHHVDPAQLSSYFSLADADHLLTSTAIRCPQVRLAKDGKVLPESTYTRAATITGRSLTGLVDAQRALSLFADGATVVFQGLHRYWSPLTGLIAQLELELGHPCQANAYLTPPGAQGFAVHSDTHDVFVLQTAGAKQWEIHGPDGVEERVLTPGDVVYFPTGTKHAARTQDAVSLHITIGINQLTWRGLVGRTVAAVASHSDDAHLPAGYLDDPSMLVPGLADRLAEVADRLRELDTDQAVATEVRRFLTSQPPRLEGGLLDGLGLAAVDDDTLLRRRTGHACVLLDVDPQNLEVLLGDRTLTVPSRLRPALEQVRGLTELRPRDLAMLDPESRMVLCRRLVREGLLEVSTP